jgi:hypothetical protein
VFNDAIIKCMADVKIEKRWKKKKKRERANRNGDKGEQGKWIKYFNLDSISKNSIRYYESFKTRGVVDIDLAN